MPALLDNHVPAINSHSRLHSSLVSVQVPFIVEDIDAAITSLGGHSSIKKSIRAEDNSPRLNLTSNLQDIFAPKQLSNLVRNRNVLLKFNIPKKTGRKRKRGSRGPFEFDDNGLCEIVRSEDVWKSLSSDPGRSRVEIVGVVPESHRFRQLPDYGWTTREQGLAHEACDVLFGEAYPEMKRFKWSPILDQRSAELLPLPTLLHQAIPYNYAYKQNPAVKRRIDESGQSRLINDSKAAQLFTFNVEFDVHQVPLEPHQKVPPLEQQPDPVPELVEKARKLFEERPIWTRRALENTLPSRAWTHAARTAYQYLGYRFKSGPWRDAYVKYGVDPRKDPSSYLYQTIMLQLNDKESDAIPKTRAPLTRYESDANMVSEDTPAKESSSRMGHIFDGSAMNFDGKVWQVCDITDPIIRPVFESSTLRSECHIAIDGWFQNATWAKIRTLLKVRARDILTGISDRTREEFSAILSIPDSIDSLQQWEKHSLVKAKTTEQAEWVVNVKNFIKQSIAKDAITIRDVSEMDGMDVDRANDSERSENDEMGT